MTKIINANNIEALKAYPDNYFDAVVTDPPYGLGKEPNAEALMKDWIENGYHEVGGTGFMGKEWDAFVPQPIFWKEVFRVLKHGGHVLSFFGTRTYDWGVMSMRFAGFEVRDCIQWLYGSGFPKSHNISKAIDKMQGAERTEIIGQRKRNVKPFDDKNGWNDNNTSGNFDYTAPATDSAKQWDGWGTALKPAHEDLVLARKPLEKGLSIAENILKWGVGGINIDASRIGTNDDLNGGQYRGENNKINDGHTIFTDTSKTKGEFKQPQGRFPANIILTHSSLCQLKGTKKVKPSNGSGKASEKGGGFSKGMFGDGTSDNIGGGFVDADGNEIVENWDCHEDCPIRILDEQSGISKSSASIRNNKKRNEDNIYGGGKGIPQVSLESNFSDKGGASRFFYCAKASKSERNKGLDGFEEKPLAFSNQAKAELKRGNADYDGGDAKGHGNSIRHLKNFHPTVKPVKLMQYLVKMITPPNGIVLDPFCGSGTTGVACKLEGFQFVGIEQDAEYSKIAQARINNFEDSTIDQVDIEQKAEPTINNDDKPQLTLF